MNYFLRMNTGYMKSKNNLLLKQILKLLRNLLETANEWIRIRENYGTFLEENIQLIDDEKYDFLCNIGDTLDLILHSLIELMIYSKEIDVRN